MQVVKQKKYTPSDTNKFYKCPFNWKLLSIDGIQPAYVENYKKLFGENGHMIIAEYYRQIGKNKPTPKQVENVAMACLNSMFDEQLKQYRADMESAIKNFIKFEQGRLATWLPPILIETMLEDENFRGKLDMFDGANIFDWKFGNLLQLEDNERRQGRIYNTLLNHNGYAGNFKVYFVTLKNGRCLELPLTTEAWLMQQIERMFTMVKAGQFPKCLSPLCNWCETQLECEFDGVGLFDGIGY